VLALEATYADGLAAFIAPFIGVTPSPGVTPTLPPVDPGRPPTGADPDIASHFERIGVSAGACYLDVRADADGFGDADGFRDADRFRVRRLILGLIGGA
jgi:hypothetical protein